MLWRTWHLSCSPSCILPTMNLPSCFWLASSSCQQKECSRSPCCSAFPSTSWTIEFCIFYLDDRTLGGRTEDVLQDFQTVEGIVRQLGLTLNKGRSEVIGTDPTTLQPLLAVTPDIQVIKPEHATLLSSPLGDLESVSEAIWEKTKSLQIMRDRLQHLHVHNAILLQHSFAIPKLLCTLRTSPYHRSPENKVYDDKLKAITSKIHQHPIPREWPSLDPYFPSGEARWTRDLECSTACTVSLLGFCCWLLHPCQPDPSNLSAKYPVHHHRRCTDMLGPRHNQSPPPEPPSAELGHPKTQCHNRTLTGGRPHP